MPKHVKVPGFIKLDKYISSKALHGIATLAWLATDPKSPLRVTIGNYIPEDDKEERLAAIREFGVVAQQALDAAND